MNNQSEQTPGPKGLGAIAMVVGTIAIALGAAALVDRSGWMPLAGGIGAIAFGIAAFGFGMRWRPRTETTTEATMTVEKKYSLNRGVQGCLVGYVVAILAMLCVSLICGEWLHLISTETQRNLQPFTWLVSICIGGYWAARSGRTTGWTNAFVVGLLAEFFVVLNDHPKGRSDQGYSLDPFLEMINDPRAHWQSLVRLALTLPAALLGGYLWVLQTTKRRQTDPTSAVPPDDTNDHA